MDPLPLEVAVPASTSNLGPGFDLLGLALSLRLSVRVLGPSGAGRHVIVEREGTAREWPEDRDDLFLRAFARAQGALGGSGGYAFAVRSEIPLARGLGSSGAAVAAGLLLGERLAPRTAADGELLAWGIALEGHPDNVTAALFGGCTLCHPSAGERGRPLWTSCPASPAIAWAVAWPGQGLAPERARAALPDQVPFEDAAENPRRLALLLEGLRSGDPELLRAGGEERLHVRHRLPLIRGAREALARAKEAGA